MVTKDSFTTDLINNYKELNRFGVQKNNAKYFLPPYEWYNDSITKWTGESGLQLINFTPGTLSHADYTTPDAKNYRTSDVIFNSIIDYEKRSSTGLNGFILLMHIGTDPNRKDKFYHQLPQLLKYLKEKNYKLVSIDQLLND